MVDGQEGLKIYPAAMLGTTEPTPENIAQQAHRIKTGDHGAGLKNVASQYCPTGFKILSEDEPEARIYVFQPYVQYRVVQEFVIACAQKS